MQAKHYAQLSTQAAQLETALAGDAAQQTATARTTRADLEALSKQIEAARSHRNPPPSLSLTLSLSLSPTS
jgi:hypothetical protein